VGNYTIGRSGELLFNDEVDQSQLELLIERLVEQGFEAEITGSTMRNNPSPDNDKPDGLVIELPRATFTDATLDNLKKLIESKELLIKSALGVESLPLEITEDKVSFHWFAFPVSPEEIKAYSAFITSLTKLAKEQKRVTAISKNVENEKYAFRCFLLRLGFIGVEYKNERRILLSKLSGSSAYKNGEAKQDEFE
jgi:Leucine-rich repeat (LRR) protein